MASRGVGNGLPGLVYSGSLHAGVLLVNRIPNTWKFDTDVARLYHLIHDPKDNPQWSKVKTPDGRGTLISAFSTPNGCRVLLDRQRIPRERQYKTGDPFKPTRSYDVRDIEEA
jgi:hypothetical protein